MKKVCSLFIALMAVFSLSAQNLENGFYLAGTMNGWGAAAGYHFVGNPSNPAEFMLETTLAVGDEFKVINYLDGQITAWYPGEGGNYVVDAAHAGAVTVYFQPDYKADWAEFGGYFYVAVPETPIADEWAEITFTGAAAADDIAEEASYAAQGSQFALTLHDAGNKMVIDANDCRFGTAEAYTMYNFRIKSGGASSSTKNYFTLNIPEAGILRVAPRTGSNSATDRALVIAQGETELYNAVVQESQAIDVQEGENTVKVYPYVEVAVAAGDVRVSYTAGMNFYAFAFKAKGGDTPVVLDAPDAAPAAPTYPAEQVKAVYSATYNADCNFGEWGSGTAYTQEEFGKKYVTTGLGYFGLEFTGMNCSEMEALHLDVWIAADATIRVVPIHGGTEVGVTVNLTGQKWNVIDIPLSSFEGVTNWSNVYQIKIDQAANLTFWLNNVYFYTTVAPSVDLADGYYLIGLNGWTVYDLAAADKFAANGENEGEYMLAKTLVEGKEFKVVAVANNAITTWYPDGANYKVDRAHAGDKTIYFRPDGQGGEGWHFGYIYVPATEDLSPITSEFFTGDGWAPDTESSAVWDEENKKITVNIALPKMAQWQSQVKYYGPAAEEGKCYHVALKMKANKAVNSVVAKYQDNAEMLFVNTNLVADVEFVIDTVVAGLPNGNGVLVMDFGYAEAGTVIVISDIVIEEAECPQQEPAYYLAGSMNGWGDAVGVAAYKFTVNPENEAEYIYKMTLAAGDEFKVVKVDGAGQAWFPGGMGDNYVVDAAHAGEKTVYFRPDGQGGEGWHYGYIYVEANAEGIDNTAAEVKAVKTVINGQLVIIKGDKIFNAVGAQIR